MQMLRLLFCSVLFSLLIFFYSDSTAQTAGESSPQILQGTPLSESVNLFEISRYPQNWTIIRDADGNLMVGTQGRVMLYDGARWTARHMPGNVTRDLKAGFGNRIYAGGMNEFGYYERDDKIMADSLRYVSLRHLVPDGISNVDRIHTVLVAEDSTVYFNGTFHSFKYRNEEFKPVSDDVWIFRLFSENGKIFSNDSLGISIYENGELNLIPGAEQFEYSGLYCLMSTEGEKFQFAQRNRGIFIYDGEQFYRQDSEASDFLQTHAPYSCKKLQDGTYIFGTLTAGAIRFDENGNILGWFHDKNGLPENTVYDIHTDIDGTVWFSHFNHITKMDFGIPIRVVNESSGYQTLPFDKLISDGTIYLGTQRGIYSKPADESFDHPYEEIFSTNSITRLFEAAGNVYFYTNRLIRAVSNPTEVLFEFPTFQNVLEVSAIDHSIIYASSIDGLMIIRNDNGNFSSSLSKITSTNLEEAQFYQNERGDIWIGSASGSLIQIPFSEIERFLEHGEASVHEYVMPDGWRGDGSSRITLVGVEGEILLGTPRGLYRIDNETNQVVEDNRFGEWSRVNESGNPNPIFKMVADEKGNIWMRASRRYQYAERQADGSYVIHHNILKRIEDDLSNAIIPDGEGKAWFLGSKGIVYYDHNLVVDKNVRPPIISRVTANTDSLIYLGYSREKSKNAILRLKYQSNDLRFEFGFPDFSTFTGTEFQVKMEGYDTDWSRWSSEAQKDYTQIREGSYTFMVRARDVTGIVTEASVLPVRILPPWYRSIWAYLLYVGLISGVVYMAHVIRVRRIMELQNIRNRIASDLHDEVSATLSSISFFAEAIDRNKGKQGNERFLDLITKSAGEAKEKITDIIWSINPENDDWVNLLSKCRRFASDLLESKGISYELDMVSDIPEKMNIELRQHLWLIFKELVTNAARHSEATHVIISFKYTSGKILITVSDNGKGFNPDEIKEGNGLRNIRKRSEKIGSVVIFNSSSDGTEWKIEHSF